MLKNSTEHAEPLFIALLFKTFRGGWGYSGKVLVCFFYTVYPILDKLYQLCQFMQTIILFENHVDGFLLSNNQSSEVINFDIIFALSE